MDRREFAIAIARQLRDITREAGPFVAGILSGDIHSDQQVAFAQPLRRLAELIREQADSPDGMVIDGDTLDDGDGGRATFTAGAGERAAPIRSEADA